MKVTNVEHVNLPPEFDRLVHDAGDMYEAGDVWQSREEFERFIRETMCVFYIAMLALLKASDDDKGAKA